MRSIFYFSGTGNTRLLAERLAARLTEASGQDHSPVNIEKFSEPLTGRQALKTISGTIILLYPVYAFDAPEIVYEFIDLFEEGADLEFILIKVGCDTIGLNGAASHFLKKKIQKRGISVVHEQIFAMPSNFLLSYPDTLNMQLVNASLIHVDNLAKNIVSATYKLDKATLAAKFLTLSFRIERTGARWFGRSLNAGDACTLCGTCVKSCPRRNIRIENGEVKFGSDCMFCMRCIYGCPEGAIRSKGMQFAIVKEGYDVNSIAERRSENQKFITEHTKGFYAHLKPYVDVI